MGHISWLSEPKCRITFTGQVKVALHFLVFFLNYATIWSLRCDSPLELGDLPAALWGARGGAGLRAGPWPWALGPLGRPASAA